MKSQILSALSSSLIEILCQHQFLNTILMTVTNKSTSACVYTALNFSDRDLIFQQTTCVCYQ